MITGEADNVAVVACSEIFYFFPKAFIGHIDTKLAMCLVVVNKMSARAPQPYTG